MCVLRTVCIDALMVELDLMIAEDDSLKSLVFSQWTSMLNLIEYALNAYVLPLWRALCAL
jgi:SNF2 family DNA or RNA helicase